MTIEPGKLESLLHSIQSCGFGYGLGFKIDPLSQQAPTIMGRNEVSGERAARVDCSGFVRWCLYHTAGVTVPDGSVHQLEWCDTRGFEKCPASDGHKLDSLLRVAFLTPEASGEGVGHVMLLLNGRTYESHGGKGPDSREWGSEGFMGKCMLYRLSE